MEGRATNYIALIPAYEPDKRMLKVEEDLAEAGFDIVIVDDGSGAEYEELFWQAGQKAAVLTHEVNKGKGAALKTGLGYIEKYRLGNGDAETVIVTVDADGQHLASDALRIARAAGADPGTLVLGSRALDEGVPLRSRLGNTITRHVYSIATGTSIHDTQTGLRAFTSGLIPQMLRISGDRYEYEINVLMEFARAGIPMKEEIIETIYLDNNSRSHFNTVKDSFRVYKEILKFSASSLISFLIDYVLYGILLAITGGLAYSLIAANIGARVISSAVNYTINRKVVFRSRAGFAKSASQYFLLAAIILAGNTAVLHTLVNTFGFGSMTAKIITELIFFIVSWTVQKYVIFYQKAEDESTVSVRSADRTGGARSMRFRTVRAPRLRECRDGRGYGEYREYRGCRNYSGYDGYREYRNCRNYSGYGKETQSEE